MWIEVFYMKETVYIYIFMPDFSWEMELNVGVDECLDEI
jgi:hypothetical protein